MLFDYYTRVKMEPSNLSRYDAFDCWVQNDGIRRILRVLLPNRKNFVTAASLDSKILQLILLILFKMVNLSFV